MPIYIAGLEAAPAGEAVAAGDGAPDALAAIAETNLSLTPACFNAIKSSTFVE